MRKVIGMLVLTALFAILLSALVVTPETEAVFDEEPLCNLCLETAALPVAQADAMPLFTFACVREVCAGLVCMIALAALVLSAFARKDHNGHVLVSCRYENSVYAVFRPEVAGG